MKTIILQQCYSNPMIVVLVEYWNIWNGICGIYTLYHIIIPPYVTSSYLHISHHHTSMCHIIIPIYALWNIWNMWNIHIRWSKMMEADATSICHIIIPPYVTSSYLHMSHHHTSMCHIIIPIYTLDGAR